MDDNYLDNVFREKLELPQQHDFDESAWLDLENRLEDKRKRRFIMPWRWIAAAGIMLPMLMMSVYFYYELQQTERQLAKLETRMNKLLNKKESQTNDKVDDKESLVINDALIENAIVLRQSATRPKSVESIVKESPVANLSPEFSTSSNTVETYTIQSKGNTQAVEINTKDAATKTYQEAIIKEEEEIASILTPLAKVENDLRAANAMILSPKNKVAANGFKRQKVVPNLNHLGLVYNTEIEAKENLWDKTTQFFTPVGFEVSVGTFRGVKIPSSEPLATIQNEKPFLENNGIEVAANFLNGVDLMLGATFAKYSYVTTTIGQDFPSSEPNNVGDIFSNVEVTEDVVQIPIGLKYNFGNYDDVFAPFAEIGMIAKRSIQKHHRFEYLPTSRGDEPYAFYPPAQKITDNFAMNTISGSVGFKVNPKMKNRILDNVILQTEAFVNVDTEMPEKTWTAGVGVSATYSF